MRYVKLAALCGLLLGGFALGGCSGDDDNGGGGGGSIKFPAVPTARPDTTTWPVFLDVSGGNAVGAQAGGNGGTINVVAGTGRVRLDDGRSLPGISTNYLTTGVLADNLVTYAEIVAIDPAAVTETGTTGVLDLSGVDFFLPSGATLDLSDMHTTFGLNTLLIRAFLGGDVIRIDGTVVANPAGATSPLGLSLHSVANTGTAIAISGTVLLTPAAATGLPGGAFNATAELGSILVRGGILSLGTGTGAGTNGGSIVISADQGSVLLREAVMQANGGEGDQGGGNGGTVVMFAPHVAEEQRVAWGFRANGGDATGSGDGGNGGSVTIDVRAPLNLFSETETNGGDSTSGDGGNAGTTVVIGMIVRGVLVASGTGGDGGQAGGNGTFPGFGVQVAGESLTGLALVADVSGGNGTNDNGGRGGVAGTQTDGRWCVNVLLDVTSNGGDGATVGGVAGSGGSALLNGFSETRNASIVIVANGGTADVAGNGGEVVAQHFSGFGEPQQLEVRATLNGGAGDSLAGDAGDVRLVPGFARLEAVVNITANGGELTGAPAGTPKGGNGGQVRAGENGNGSVELTVSGSMAGGFGGTIGDGGFGGALVMQMLPNAGSVIVNTVGTLNLRGGAATAGTGGEGGSAELSCGANGHFETDLLNLDMRGGDSAQGNGGPGDFGFGFQAQFLGPAWFRGGTIDLSGGNGSTVSGTAVGGDWGRAGVRTNSHDIHFGATVLANGGNGVSEGGGVNSGAAIEIDSDSNVDGIAGTIRMTGTLRSRGGNASAGGGGAGGFIYVHGFDTNTPISGGDIYVSGLIECIGGAGQGTGSTGGQASGIEISSAGNVLDISGTVRLTGGSGDTGGTMNNLELGASAITNIRISGIIEAVGGSALGVAVSGPLVQISTPAFSDEAASILVTSSAEIRSNGGAGGTTNGGAGFIEFDAQGAGTNVTIETGATVECLDGAGVNAPANITIN